MKPRKMLASVLVGPSVGSLTKWLGTRVPPIEEGGGRSSWDPSGVQELEK